MAKSFTYAILEWARTKPADETYRYLDNCGCVVAQFLIAAKRAKAPIVYSDPAWQARVGGPYHRYPEVVDIAACEVPHTFGAFTDRLEAELA